VSGLFAFVALLFFALWLFSYGRPMVLNHPQNTVLQESSVRIKDGWIVYQSITRIKMPLNQPPSSAAKMLQGVKTIQLPIWLGLVLSLAEAALIWPWQRRGYRFTLRELFLVTTVAAVLLGLIAWTHR
jgi:hypothetical protein